MEIGSSMGTINLKKVKSKNNVISLYPAFTIIFLDKKHMLMTIKSIELAITAINNDSKV
jgi:hypothetical protein